MTFDIINVLVEFLRIDCSIAQCTGYPSEIEALFYVFFMPTVFVILFIYLITSFAFRGEETKMKGLRLLISIIIFGLIIFQEWFTYLVVFSKFWFILVIILIGLWVLLRFFFTGKIGKGGGAPAGGLPATSSTAKSISSLGGTAQKLLSGRFKRDIADIRALIKEIKDLNAKIRSGKHSDPGRLEEIKAGLLRTAFDALREVEKDPIYRNSGELRALRKELTSIGT